MIIRVRKQDSAYLYQILESYEGLTNYSTLTEEKGLPYRDIQLHFSPELLPLLKTVLERLKSEIEVEVLSASN